LLLIFPGRTGRQRFQKATRRTKYTPVDGYRTDFVDAPPAGPARSLPPTSPAPACTCTTPQLVARIQNAEYPAEPSAQMGPATAQLASGNRCISIGHKTQVPNSTLLALRQVGVTYISTRSIGCNHIDVEYAAGLGISVENVTYSPDSVADYTLMLMLMTVRHA